MSCVHFTTDTTAVAACWKYFEMLGGRGREAGCDEECNRSNCREMHLFFLIEVSFRGVWVGFVVGIYWSTKESGAVGKKGLLVLKINGKKDTVDVCVVGAILDREKDVDGVRSFNQSDGGERGCDEKTSTLMRKMDQLS